MACSTRCCRARSAMHAPEVWSQRLRRFAEDECRGLSPLYESIGLGLANDPEMLRWLAATLPARAHATLPFAAVHFLLLNGSDGGGLEAFYPSLTETPAPAEHAYPHFRGFCERNLDQLAALLANGLTQTNEVGRCTYLLPSFVLAEQRVGRPLSIVEVGCSAGLNLLFDRYSYDYGGGHRAGNRASPVKLRASLRNSHPSTAPLPTITGRVGVDLAPIDAADARATRWLEACIWPEHTERLTNLRAALDIARRDPPQIVAGNAVEVLPRLVAEVDEDSLLVVVNTNVIHHFTPDERARYGAQLLQIGANRDLIWIANEHPLMLEAAGFTAPTAIVDGGLPLVMRDVHKDQREDN